MKGGGQGQGRPHAGVERGRREGEGGGGGQGRVGGLHWLRVFSEGAWASPRQKPRQTRAHPSMFARTHACP